MKTIFFLLICFIISNNVSAQNDSRWVLLTINSTDQTEWYYDSQTIKITDNIVTVWIKTIYPDEYYIDGILTDYSIEKINFHCGSDKYIIEDLTRYHVSAPDKTQYDVNKEIQVFPDAVSEFLYNYVCNSGNIK